MENSKYYLKIGRASDLKNTEERNLYRFFEMLPALLAWLTLILLVIFSAFLPIWVAFFIIIFDIYWLLKTIYLSLHLRSAYKRMRINLKRDWPSPPSHIYHLIIFPMYQEDIEVVRASLAALTKEKYPQNKMIVVLATEEKAGEYAQTLSNQIKKEFDEKFLKFIITVHPKNIVGEIPGKGSNTTWAGRQAKKIIDELNIPYKNVIVSNFDIDSIITPGYFSCLTDNYLTAKKPLQTSFQPIPFFINNIWQAPAFARVISFSATFWHLLQQERPERSTTFSSHSMSFQTLVDINFWQTNVVSEDSRIFWQCFLYYNGDYQVQPLYFPISMDANVAPTFWQTIKNQYKQQRRWGYGVENIPYMLFGFYKNNKISFWKKLRWAFVIFEGFHSWATNALIIFIFGWLPLFIGGSDFNITVLSKNLPILTRDIMTLSMAGLVTSAILSMNLLPPRPPEYGRFKYILMLGQWVLLPATIIIFGALPGLEAQTRLMFGKYLGFWVTPKTRHSK